MADKANLISGYNERGFSSVLKAAANLVERASLLMDKCGDVLAPAVNKDAYRKEAAVCLAEAEELIAAVRKEGRL